MSRLPPARLGPFGGLALGVLGCSPDALSLGSVPEPRGVETSAADVGDAESSSSGGAPDLEAGSSSGTGPAWTPPKPRPTACRVDDNALSPLMCERPPPTGAPRVVQEWKWEGVGFNNEIGVSPLVVNFTDDNGDGYIDLCDTPDVIVIAASRPSEDFGTMFVLSGDTGEPLLEFSEPVMVNVTPAVGDIDGDGEPEIVAARGFSGFGTIEARLAAFDTDGTVLWDGFVVERFGSAVALADLDNDGDVEVVMGNRWFDHEGDHIESGMGSPSRTSMTVAADLDGDRDLEIITGRGAYHHDGTPYYELNIPEFGHPQVANLDDDDDPEVLLTTWGGIYVIEHDGTIKSGPETPGGYATTGEAWQHPAVIDDLNGDASPDAAQLVGSRLVAYDRSGFSLWVYSLDGGTGMPSPTAFDFMADGSAEVLFMEEGRAFASAMAPSRLFSVPRSGRGDADMPVVADVDGDGNAELIVTSNEAAGGDVEPTVQVFGDTQGVWGNTRRIWNQHTYHVTNVLEDGGIPRFEKPHWKSFNTFRVNPRVEDGRACVAQIPVEG